ncbi:MAG: hypothetical protein MSS98_04655, partial [Alphaproteobacteria bacterium]|nr:hypothetical protein [Alphaproteobacteria bacterium]MDY4689162.1 hypothetical protein [Alphaproteobacteria bacterium]
SESIIFSAESCKNVLNGRKSAFNQMFRICRERERDLLIAYFSSFFPLKLVILHFNSIPAEADMSNKNITVSAGDRL